MNVKTVTEEIQDSIPLYDTPLKGAEAIPPVGWTMLSEGKWLEAARSYGITVKLIVLVVAILSLMAGFFSGIKFDRSRSDTFVMNGSKFIMVGITEIEGHKGLFIPIYKTELQGSKDYRGG